MSQLLVTLWISAIGIVATAPVSRWAGPIGTAAIAPIVGTSAYLLAGAALAAAGVYSVVGSLAVISVLVMAGTTIALRARLETATARTLTAAVGMTIGSVTAVNLIAQQIPAARLTLDSHGYVVLGSLLESTGGLDALLAFDLLQRQLAVPLLQATGWFGGGAGYAPVFGLLFGATALATLAWMVQRAAARHAVRRSHQVLLIASGFVLLLTTNRFVYHLAYINSHMMVGAMLLVAVGVAWISIVEDDLRPLYLAGLVIGAMSIVRAELLVVAAAVLLPFLTHPQLTMKNRLALTVPTTVAAAGWFGLVLPRYLPESETSAAVLYGNAAAALVLGVAALVVGSRVLRSLAPQLPWVFLGAAIGATALFAMDDPEILVATLQNTATNLAVTGGWGFFWYLALPMGLACLVAGSAEEGRLLSFGALSFLILLPLLAYLRGNAYRLGGGDSANRMLIHIVPLLVAYLLISALTAARGDSPTATGEAAEAG